MRTIKELAGRVPYASIQDKTVRPFFQTIRIPLTAFCDIKLQDVSVFQFEFDVHADTIDGERRWRGAIALDNLEFIHEVRETDSSGPYIPIEVCGEICGNGIVSANESCDDGNHDDDDACPNNCYIPNPPPGDDDCIYADSLWGGAEVLAGEI